MENRLAELLFAARSPLAEHRGELIDQHFDTVTRGVIGRNRPAHRIADVPDQQVALVFRDLAEDAVTASGPAGALGSFRIVRARSALGRAALMMPSYSLTAWMGSRLFRESNEKLYRGVALAFLTGAGIIGLLA